jgi:CRISPR-associated protein Cmr2
MKHLLAIAVGPVQDFIAAARRTSDLTAGSQLLVEIAKATAKAVRVQGGVLIFPADADSDGPNKILAKLPEGTTPQAVAKEAKAAAINTFKAQWDSVRPRIRSSYKLEESLADAQIERFLEFYAAWYPYDETDNSYSNARRRVEALLAGRKNLRDFRMSPDGANTAHGKSPLDPAFECVLTMPQLREGEEDSGFLKLRRTEFLDAISLLKRVKGQDEAKTEETKVPATRAFARRQKTPGYMVTDAQDSDEQEVYPYFAILVADGDKMGEILNKLKTPEKHREFSGNLANFADEAKGVIRHYDGYPVYTGGDDVLAFLPVRSAVACAEALAAKFAEKFKEKVKGTLSAGVAIVHYRQPLSLSLQAARQAEKAAKDGGRDSLCLALHTRGGQPLLITQKWEAWQDFGTWLAAFEKKQLTRGVAYELRGLAREFENLTVPPELLCLEAERIWKRKQSESKDKITFPKEKATTTETLKTFADTLVAARFLTAEGEEEEKK